MAFAKKSGPSFGISEKSMSLSPKASIRFQSVLDCLFIFLPLFMICLSQRDDANYVVTTFRKNYGHGAAANHSDSFPTPLRVIVPYIRGGNDHSSKHLFSVCEVETVLPNIGVVLGLIPLECHFHSTCNYKQSSTV